MDTHQEKPYMGLETFGEEQQAVFFGRDKETRDLQQAITQNAVTVVFGKSGTGKSSLLQAGIIPALKKEYYLPIYVRINFGSATQSPLEQLKRRILEAAKPLFDFGLGQATQADFTPQAFPSREEILARTTLWELTQRISRFHAFFTPLLIFDQFEELFTLGQESPETAQAFILALTDLIENNIPTSVYNRYVEAGKTIPDAFSQQEYRVVIALREDYLPHLDDMYSFLPAIRKGRYRVLEFDGENALQAIYQPARHLMDQTTAQRILDKLPERGKKEFIPKLWVIRQAGQEATRRLMRKHVEPFLLSLFCYQLNERRIQKGLTQITPELVEAARMQDIVEDHYEQSFRKNDNTDNPKED